MTLELFGLLFVSLLITTVFLLLAVGTYRAARCNWRRFKTVRTSPPLSEMSDSAIRSQFSKPWTPRRWPKPGEGDGRPPTATRCLAYGGLARSRAENISIAGEVVIVLASATVGLVLLTGAVELLQSLEPTPGGEDAGRSAYVLLGALGAATLGGVLRVRSAWWHRLATEYEVYAGEYEKDREERVH